MSQQINLFDPLFLKQKHYFSARTMVQGLGLVAAGVLCFSAIVAYQVNGLSAQMADTDRQLEEARQQLVQAGAGANAATRQGRGQVLKDEIERTEIAVRARRQLLDGLQGANVGVTDGFSKYLIAFARRPLEGVWLTGFSVSAARNELTIHGRALRADLIPAYIHLLNSEAALRGMRVSEFRLAAKEETPQPLVSGGASKDEAPGAKALVAETKPPTLKFIEFTLGTERSSAPSATR